MSSREMGKVMEKAVKGVYREIIYGVDPSVMLPMIRETEILTVDGFEPYYDELNKMIEHGRSNADINKRLLEILFTRDRWWIVFIRVCRQCEYHGIIQAIEEELTPAQRSELHQQIQPSTRMRRSDGKTGGMSNSDMRRQFDRHSRDSNSFSDAMPLTKASTQRTDPRQGNTTWEGDQWDAGYTTQMNSNIGRSPGTLTDDVKKITIEKKPIHFAPNTQETENNLSGNVFEDAFKEFTISKKDTNKTSAIEMNIPPDRAINEVDPDTNLKTGEESSMRKIHNLWSLEKDKFQIYSREDDSDTRTASDDATNEWIHEPCPSFRNHHMGSHRDNREGRAPYVSQLIIQSQLDQQRKLDGTARCQEAVSVEYQSTECLEDELPMEKEERPGPESP